jgi:hypothetical protein
MTSMVISKRFETTLLIGRALLVLAAANACAGEEPKRRAAPTVAARVASAKAPTAASARPDTEPPTAPMPKPRQPRKSGPAAAVYVLDASKSMGKNPAERCKQMAVRLRSERAALRPREDLLVYVLALGRGQGAMHQRLIDWRSVAGAAWSKDLTEDPDALKARAREEQRRVIDDIERHCEARIEPTEGSPVLNSVQRAVELLNHECTTELEHGCSRQRIHVFSDMQDPDIFAAKPRVATLAAATIHACGYAESAHDLAQREQATLVARWRDRFGAALSLAPNCAIGEDIEKEASRG